MTLFHLKEIWSINCGDDEEFDRGSLCICNIDNSINEFDKIITASFKGLLRVFKIGIINFNQNESTQTQASDLLLETDLKEPILQISSGLLLASTNIQLAVLHPNKFCVYSISSSSGMTEHGTSYNILLIYEHKFEFQAVNMLLGSFGQIKDKDIVCIQDIDSTLNFYENESFSFSFKQSGNSTRNFPMQLAYVAHKDLIIVVDSLYTLECYRFQELALANVQNDKIHSKENKILSEWTYLFGELVVDIQTVLVEKWYIVVLGERNLCVLRDNGSLWFIKKFDVNPSCLCSFANESKDSLITIVGTHMYNMLIYQNDVLKWASKIPFVPVTICRSNLMDMSGIIVLLSDEGHIAAGYLGTNPSLKMISMPSLSDSANSENINKELQELKKTVNAYNLEDNKSVNSENKFASFLEFNLIQIKKEQVGIDNFVNKFNAIFEISTLTNLNDVKLIFYPNEFFEILPDKMLIDKLVKSFKFETQINVKLFSPLSTNVKACIVFNHENIYRTITKSIEIPFETIITLEMSMKSHKYQIQITFDKSTDDKSNLGFLFKEILRDSSSPSNFSFYFTNRKQDKATIKYWIKDNININYQIESNTIGGLYLTANQLINRIKQTNKTAKLVSLAINFHPIDNLCFNINNRLKHRNSLGLYKKELANFSQYYRLIQKRILVKIKDKNPTSLNNLEKLLKIIQIKINENVEKISVVVKTLNIVNYQVWAHLKILKFCIKLSTKTDTDKLKKFFKIISINQMNDFANQWEEQFEWSLFEILELNRDITNMTKMIDYENNSMQNSQNIRATLLEAFQLFSNQDNQLCSIQINK